MDSVSPPLLMIISIIGIAMMLSAFWLSGKGRGLHDTAPPFLLGLALVTASVQTHFQHIDQLKEQYEQTAAENERLQQYDEAFKEAFAGQMQMVSSGTCDAECLEQFRRMVLTLPLGYPHAAVHAGCKNPEAMRRALLPLLVGNRIRVGTNPAIDEIVVCMSKAP